MKRFLSALTVLALAGVLLCGCSLHKYTVTFDVGGGEVVSGELIQTVKEGQSATPPSLQKGSDTYEWSSDDWQNVTQDVIIRAQWTHYYTVIFDLGDGKTETQTVAEGDDAVPPAAEREGYTLSWEGNYKAVSADETVTAVWTRKVLSEDELRQQVSPSLVKIIATDGEGTSVISAGFFADEKGTVLTGYQGIHMAEKISVVTAAGETLDVTEITAFSPFADAAVLKTGARNTKALPQAEEVKNGEKVFAFGAPGGSFYAGTVLSTDERVDLVPCLKTDAVFTEEELYGPLVNERGEVVALCSYAGTEAGTLAMRAEKTEAASYGPMSLKDYAAWIARETAAGVSWSPMDKDENCYYSLIHTYTQVTGAPCILSNDLYSDYEGYRDCCYYYKFDYEKAKLDSYTDYLKSLGMTLRDTRQFDAGTSYYYWSALDGVCVDCYVTADGESLYILPKYNYIE